MNEMNTHLQKLSIIRRSSTAHALIFIGGQHLFLDNTKPPQNPIGKDIIWHIIYGKHFPRQGGVYIVIKFLFH